MRCKYSAPRKNIPNIPATLSTWIRLAPVTLRERKIRSGTSGLRAVASRATKAASSASERAPSAGERHRRDPDRDVHEEDPVPVDRLRQHAADEQANRAAGGGDEGEDADRLGLLPRFREHGDDHAENDRRGHRAARALEEPRPHQHLLALRDPAQQRGHREHPEPDEKDALAGDEVPE